MTGLDNLRDAEAALATGQPLSFREHLVNALGTSSKYADEIARELKVLYDANPEGRSRTKFILTTLIRKAVTISTTHKQLAQLVRGEDLDDRDLRRTREAEIYKRIKTVQFWARGRTQLSGEEVARGLEEIMEYIREDSDVN